MERLSRLTEIRQAEREGLRAEQLTLVLNIIKQASRSLDPATFFRLLVDTIYREVKTFSHVSIFEHDPGRGRIKAMAMAGEGGKDTALSGILAPAGALAHVLRTGAAYMSNNLQREARGAFPMAPLSRAALCIPIRTGERTIGLLNIESRQTEIFTPSDVALFEILCEHLANFLQGVNLYEEVRRKSVKIQRITEICRKVFEAAHLDEALQIAVRRVVDEYGYYCACVAILSDDGRHLVHRAHHAQVEIEVPRGYRQEVDRGIVGRVARDRRTVCCNDTSVEPDYVGLVGGVLAELCIPLLAGETLVGVLDVSAREVNAFDSEDVSLMETLGGQLALVMEKARYLQQTEETRDYLENLIGGAGDGILALDIDGRIVRWNQGMERLTEYRAGEIIGRSFLDLPAPESLEKTMQIVERAKAGEIIQGAEERMLRRDGVMVDVALTLSPVKGPGTDPGGVSVIVRDMTERRRMESSVRVMHRQILESEEKFIDMVEKAHDAIFLVDASTGGILQANAMAETMTGLSRSELIGRAVADLHPEEERGRASRHFDDTVGLGAGPSIELTLSRGSGPPLSVEVTSSVLRYAEPKLVQWFCRDISDRRRAEKEKETLQIQLLQTEKLSALGQLISGVAHELNNPLTGVIGYSQLLSSQKCEEKIKRGLEKVYSEAKRCHRIVQNLLTFARKHKPEKQPISINDIIESTVELRSYQLRVDDITVEMSLSKDLPQTLGDFHQLQQVFMNIIINAHQAMKEIDRPGVLSLKSTSDAGMILVEISDNGPGIPGEHVKKIFDPFFTTKPTGQGTGLGLSICYGIIEQHDGKIYVESAPGGGTTFSIALPVVRQEAPTPMPGTGASIPDGRRGEDRSRGGPARLLVVDDEQAIVDVLCEALRAGGHQVDAAISGRLALEKIREETYDAVITDLRMPGMNGMDLFREVSRLKPELAVRFVFSTGDIVSAETRDFLERAGKPWVEKPFDVDKVAGLLDEVLAGRA